MMIDQYNTPIEPKHSIQSHSQNHIDETKPINKKENPKKKNIQRITKLQKGIVNTSI